MGTAAFGPVRPPPRRATKEHQRRARLLRSHHPPHRHRRAIPGPARRHPPRPQPTRRLCVVPATGPAPHRLHLIDCTSSTSPAPAPSVSAPPTRSTPPQERHATMGPGRPGSLARRRRAPLLHLDDRRTSHHLVGASSFDVRTGSRLLQPHQLARPRPGAKHSKTPAAISATNGSHRATTAEGRRPLCHLETRMEECLFGRSPAVVGRPGQMLHGQMLNQFPANGTQSSCRCQPPDSNGSRQQDPDPRGHQLGPVGCSRRDRDRRWSSARPSPRSSAPLTALSDPLVL